MLKLYQFLTLIVICSLFPAFCEKKKSNKNPHNNLKKNYKKPNKNTNPQYPQKLTVIGYASDATAARHLVSFSKRYELDIHLIGADRPWGGFNDKIEGFHSFIASIDNSHNDSVILILDSYDTVPICCEEDLLAKFNAFNADIVMSTGKDCWPDPNVGSFLTSHLTQNERESHSWFPWFLCPNSGAIMGKHDVMLTMFSRVRELVAEGNGSCADFEGNKFSKNTQSDQRCYTTYFVELLKYKQYAQEQLDHSGKEQPNVIDISKLAPNAQSKDYGLLSQYYAGISMKLDYANDLFLSMGGMMFMDFDVEMTDSAKHVTFRSKITNGTSCILHGNGPGVILWRSFIKQIKNNGDLYVDDYVLRVGVDFFHWILWWVIMPVERLSHWLSVTYKFDLGFHSTTFSEEVIWRFHVWTFVGIVLVIGLPLLYWYKYKFIKTMKVNKKYKHQLIKENKSSHSHSHSHGLRKSNSFLNINNSHPITKQLVKGLVNLEIMVHHNGNTFPLLKTQKNS